MGVDIAKAVLAAGHAVVATGRDAAKVAAAVGDHDNLLAIKLDVTRPQDAQAAVEAAVAKFGRIDVLVNNAGNFFAGFFEELSPEQVRNQIETLLFGPMNVTRAVLPVMRKQRSGLLLTISSTAGIAGQMFCTAYAAAKFGIEGWMESLTPEIAPFGIRTMLVEPGFFRTELLTNDSTTYAKPSIDDYAEKTKEIVAAWKSMDGKQGGDPAKLADALVKLVALQDPPTRFAAGADAVQTFEAKANTLLAQARPTASCPPLSRTTTPKHSVVPIGVIQSLALCILYRPRTTSIPDSNTLAFARLSLPTCTVRRTLSIVRICETLATESCSRLVIRAASSRFPGASAQRRFVVKGTQTVVARRLRFRGSPCTITTGLRKPGPEPVAAGNSAHQMSP